MGPFGPEDARRSSIRSVVAIGLFLAVVGRVHLRPLFRLFVEAGAVVLVLADQLRTEAMVAVGIAQQRGQAKEQLVDGEAWRPLLRSENVQANLAVSADVGVVDPRRELALGRLEWILLREVDSHVVLACGKKKDDIS